MGKSKKIVISMAAAILIPCIMQWYTVYAAASSSQLQPANSTAVSEGGDANEDMPVQEIADTEALGSESSNQNGDEQLTDTADQNNSEQPIESSGQDVNEQSTGSSDHDMNEQASGDSQGDGEQTDEDQEEIMDDDEWADGDDEWTDAWTGVDDDIADDEWADDGDKTNEAKITNVNSVDPYDGEEGYTTESTVSNISSNSYHKRLDQNYQTGAGLGNDIFLVLAVVCGVVAIGLAARKGANKN